MLFLLQKYLKWYLSLIYIVEYTECSTFCITLNICKLQATKIRKVYIRVLGALDWIISNRINRKKV